VTAKRFSRRGGAGVRNGDPDPGRFAGITDVQGAAFYVKASRDALRCSPGLRPGGVDHWRIALDAPDRAVQRLHPRSHEGADRVVIAGGMIGVVSMQALHASGAAPHAPDGTVNDAGWNKGISLLRVPIVGGRHSRCKGRVTTNAPLHGLDAACRF
jgi:hypothetical protein